MPPLDAQTVKTITRALHGYELDDAAAEALAQSAAAMLADARSLDELGLEGVEPPFSYEVLLAEAERLMKAGR